MKIVFVVDSMNSGGTERVVSILANNFVNKGNDVTLLFASTANIKSFYSLSTNINIVTIIKNGRKCHKPFSRVRCLRKKICEINPDIVLSFLSHINIYTWLALRKTSIPYILCERNNPKTYSKTIKILLKKAFNQSNGCIFQSSYAMNYYGERITKKSKVIFNPFDTDNFIPKIRSKNLKSIISIGRLVPQKRFDLLINAFEIFLKKHSDYVLHIYGEGPMKETLLKTISKKHLSTKIFLEGTTKNIKQALYKSNLFVLCSDYEGMPNSLGEALLSGLPCVVNDSFNGGASELMNLFGLESSNFENNPFIIASLMSENINAIPNQKNRLRLDQSFICDQWLQYCEDIING